MALTTCPLSEVPSFPKCTSYALQSANVVITDGDYLWWELVPPTEQTAVVFVVRL